MTKNNLALTLLLTLFLTGCATGPTPQNADEYRAGVIKGGYGVSVKSYNSPLSYKKAVRKLKKQTKKCLRVRYKSTSCIKSGYSQNCSEAMITFRPKITSKKKRTTLQVQRGMDPDNGIYMGGPPPKGGMIVAVIDVLPFGRNKSKVNVYSPDSFFTDIPKSVKHWLTSSNKGCPNLVGD